MTKYQKLHQKQQPAENSRVIFTALNSENIHFIYCKLYHMTHAILKLQKTLSQEKETFINMTLFFISYFPFPLDLSLTRESSG